MRKILSAAAVVGGLTTASFGGVYGYNEFLENAARLSDARVARVMELRARMEKYEDIPAYNLIHSEEPHALEYRMYAREYNSLMRNEEVAGVVKEYEDSNNTTTLLSMAFIGGVILASVGLDWWRRDPIINRYAD